MAETIDLQKLTGNRKILAGMQRGEAARDMFGLDALDEGSEPVEIVAPPQLEAIAPSFVQGLFAKTFELLGAEGLRKKYRFAVDKDLLSDIENGIRRLTMRRSIAGLTNDGDLERQ